MQQSKEVLANAGATEAVAVVPTGMSP